jgi:hypothetical protein
VQVDTVEYAQAWEQFLRRYSWDLYAHLTFRGCPPPCRAEDKFRKWIHTLNRKLYGQSYWRTHEGVRWVRGEELQRREVIHYHALIGHGQVVAPFGNTLTTEFAEATWRKLAGDGRVETYQPAKRGISYLAKKYTPGCGRIILSANLEAAPL